MKTVTFSCETITPMFMYGADDKTPELRPASIKGVIRFWWRAINGDSDIERLKEAENRIFGNTEKKSSFSIKIKNYRFQNNKILGTFEIKFLLSNRCNFDIENFFKMVILLGGFGKSAKKLDKGKIKILKIQRDEKDWIEYKQPNSLEDIILLLPEDKFEIKENEIISKNFKFNYPMIHKIWIDNRVLKTKLKEDKIFQRKLDA